MNGIVWRTLGVTLVLGAAAYFFPALGALLALGLVGRMAWTARPKANDAA